MKWLIFIPLLVGCGQANKEIAGSWVSVEKPPLRVIYVNEKKSVSPEMVQHLIRQVKTIPYKDYKFNDNIGISVSGSGSSQVSNTQSDTVSVTRPGIQVPQ